MLSVFDVRRANTFCIKILWAFFRGVCLVFLSRCCIFLFMASLTQQ